jgi:hypothetical protein
MSEGNSRENPQIRVVVIMVMVNGVQDISREILLVIQNK